MNENESPPMLFVYYYNGHDIAIAYQKSSRTFTVEISKGSLIRKTLKDLSSLEDAQRKAEGWVDISVSVV